MTTESGAPAGDFAAPADDSEISLTEARAWMDANYSEDEELKPAESAEPATAEDELAQANADPEEAPREDAKEVEPEDKLPPIDPPRSWTKEEKEEFATYPREAQEKIARREQERETNLRRSQNEIAEQRKAAQAEREEAAKARQTYESKLTSTIKVMEDALQAEFGDIKDLSDVRKLQAEDPFRFQAWQVRQMELTAAKAEELQVNQRQAQEKQSKRSAYEDEQNKLLLELVPEMGEPKKAAELRDRAVKMLTDDLGLKNDQLSRWMADDIGHEILSNAAIQKIIADGLKLKDIQNAPKAVAAKPLPQVQRPGVARPAGAVDSENIQALEKRLTQTGSEKDAWALYEARLKASNRRAS